MSLNTEHMLFFASSSLRYSPWESAETNTDCINIDLALPMDLIVVSFTLAVKNHRSYTLENTVERR